MSPRDDIVCRLCLKVPHSEFVLIDETSRQGLDVLSVKMNFDVSNNPSMCLDCLENFKKSLSFILACLNSEKSILLLDNGDDQINIDLRNLCVHNSNRNICADSYICRFCIKAVEEKNINRLDDIIKQVAYLNIFKEYMFKMDLNIVKDPMICFDCRDNVQNCVEFLRNCYITEDRINTYLQSRILRSGEKVMLSTMFQQFSISTLEYPWQTQVCEVKKEPSMEVTEFKFNDIHNLIRDVKEELASEDDNSLLHQNGDMNVHIWCTCDTKGGSCLGCCPISNEDIKIESVSSEMNGALKTELDIIEEVSIKSNMLRHQHRSEVMMYKCTVCDFKTIYKSGLKRHSLIHKTEAEVTMYKCTTCGYKTKYKSHLRLHLMTHKTEAEVTMYNCTACGYKTRRKDNLNTHLLIHRKEVEVTMYQCTTCNFKTKYKKSLKIHSVAIHKTEAEMKTFKCTDCDFKTIHNKSFKNHLMSHKTEAEITMYKCTTCNFKTKRRDALNSHSLTHKTEAEVTMYKCTVCDFRTKRRHTLKSHSLTHKTEAEVTMYECTVCNFKTKYKHTHKRHLLTHKTETEVTMYKCASCDFKTRHKRNLKGHLLTHKSEAE